MRILASLSVDKNLLSKNLRLKMVKSLSQCVLGNYEFQPAIPDNEEQLASVEVVDVLKFSFSSILQSEAAGVLAKYVTELNDQMRRQATFAMLALLEHQIQRMQTPFALDILYEFAPAIPTDLIHLIIKKLIALIKSENYALQKEVLNIFIRLSWRLDADQALEIALVLNYIMDRGQANYRVCFNAIEVISDYIDPEKKHALIVDVMNSISNRHANLDPQPYLFKRLVSLTPHIQAKSLNIVVEKLFATVELTNDQDDDTISSAFKHFAEGVGDVACTAIGCYADRMHREARIKFIKHAPLFQAENVAEMIVKLATNGVLEEERIFLRPHLLVAYQHFPMHAAELAELVEQQELGVTPPAQTVQTIRI